MKYAARVIGKGRWVAEMRVPCASLDSKPKAGVRYPLNLSVRKQDDDPWVMWRGTGDCTWYVPEAGLVTFGR